MKTIIQQITGELVEKMMETLYETRLDLNKMSKALVEDCQQAVCHIVEAYAAEVNRTIREEKQWRKEQGLVLKEKGRPRRVVTEFGEVNLERDYYRDTVQGGYVVPLDQILGIQKYERVLSSVGAELVMQATEVPYAKSAQLVTGGRVSRQTVRNKLMKIKVPEREPAFRNKPVKELHIFADEDHVHLQLPKKRRGRKNQIVPEVTVTEGIRPVSGRRRETICPMHFVDKEFGTKNLWKSVSGYLAAAYDQEQLERIYLHADGGYWIAHGLEEFAQTVHVMDGFHFEREVKRVANRFQGRNVRGRIHKAVEEGSPEKADRILEGLMEVSENEATREKVKQFQGYLRTHWEEIRRRIQEEIPGSCTEGQISHLLSERFSRDPMGWSKEGLGQLSAARIYVKNGGILSSKDFQREGETSRYQKFAEEILEESRKGAIDWSLFEQQEPRMFDTASGTQQALHHLGATHSLLN